MNKEKRSVVMPILWCFFFFVFFLCFFLKEDLPAAPSPIDSEGSDSVSAASDTSPEPANDEVEAGSSNGDSPQRLTPSPDIPAAETLDVAVVPPIPSPAAPSTRSVVANTEHTSAKKHVPTPFFPLFFFFSLSSGEVDVTSPQRAQVSSTLERRLSRRSSQRDLEDRNIIPQVRKKKQ